jgi:hypothetical protein
MKRFYVEERGKLHSPGGWCTHVVRDRESDDHVLCVSREDLCEIVASSMNFTSTTLYWETSKIKGKEADVG